MSPRASRCATVRSGLLLAVCAGLLFAVVPAGAHAARTPKGGCWGTCGGDVGPRPADVLVYESRLTGFGVAEACLGQVKVTLITGTISESRSIGWSINEGLKPGETARPGIPISHGKVTFDRKAKIAGTQSSVPVKLELTFVSSSTVKGTIYVKHGSCKRFSFTAHGTEV